MPPRTRRVPRGGATTAANSDDAGQSSSAAASESAPQAKAPASEQSNTASTSEVSAPATTTARTAGSRSFKLRPKVVRRADEERKALAEQEEKKLLDRAAADDARRRKESRMRGGRGRGRGGRGRGRGDFSGGRDGLIRRTVAPDGPFSQIPGSLSQGRGRQGHGGFGAGGSGGGGGFGSGGRGSGSGSGGFISNSGPAEEVDLRLNTDMFNGRMADYADGDDITIKDEFAAETISSTSSGKKAPQLLPMGIKREEHRDTGMVVAATDELEAAGERDAGDDADAEDSGSDLFIENGDETTAGVGADDNEVWSRAIKSQRGVKLVGPDGQEIEVTDIDTLAEKRQEIAAAAAAAEKAPGEEEAGRGARGEEGSSGSAAKTKKRRPQKERDPEEVIVEEGLQAMLHDLAIDPPRDFGAAPVAISSGESAGEDEQQRQKQQEAAEAPQREGRLFLFQFPPVLPSLQSFKPASPSAGSVGGTVKQEPVENSDIVMLESVPPAVAVAVDSSGGSGSDGGDNNNNNNNNNDNGRKQSDIGEGGFLGTLTIRKSGRAELSWGGMTYEMMPGADVQFLTTAVLLEDADEKANPGDGQATAAIGGNAFGMGPVGGKYNLVPVFSSETEWAVDPSELEMFFDDEDDDDNDDDDGGGAASGDGVENEVE